MNSNDGSGIYQRSRSRNINRRDTVTELTMEKQKIKIPYEWVTRKYLYLFGSFSFLSLIILVFKENYLGVLLLFLMIETIFYGINKFLNQNILLSIDEKGIYINENRFIAWNEIVSWEYFPGTLKTNNRLEIITDIGNKFSVEGFGYRKLSMEFKKYIPEKQKPTDFTIDFITITLIVIFSIGYWLLSKK